MRSRCRSVVLSLWLASTIGAVQLGPLCFSFLFIEPAQAKGGADTTAGDADTSEGGSKCSTVGGAVGNAAGGPPRHHRFNGGLPAEGLDFSMLNLSDEQKSKIKAIRGRNAARAKELRQSFVVKGKEFRDLIFSETATNEQVTAKRDEFKAVKDELDNLRLNDLLAIRAVFTPEQRKKWAESKPPDLKPHGKGGGPSGSGDDGDKPDKADKGAAGGATVKVK